MALRALDSAPPAPGRPAARSADPRATAVGGGAGDGCALRGRRPGRAGRGDRAGAAGQAGPGRWGGMPDVNIGVLEKAGSLGEHNLSGAVVNPRALRELFPEMHGRRTSPSARRWRGEAVYLLTESRRLHHSDATHDAQQRLLHRLALRAGALAGRAGGGSWGSTSSPGSRPSALLVEGQAVTGVRTTPSGLDRDGDTGRRLPGAHRPHGPGHGPDRRDPGPAGPGVAGVAEGRLGQSADLRAGRQGSLEGQAAARSGHPHPGLAAAA